MPLELGPVTRPVDVQPADADRSIGSLAHQPDSSGEIEQNSQVAGEKVAGAQWEQSQRHTRAYQLAGYGTDGPVATGD